jgi:DNA processing protein
MPLRELAATLLLITRGSSDPGDYAVQIESKGSAYAVLLSERLAAAPQTSFFTDPEAELDTELTAIEPRIREWRFQGVQLLSILDASFPDNLRRATTVPPLLFVAGRLKPRDDTAVAVIGGPEPDRDELRAAEEIAAGLAEEGRTVISGLGTGIDTAAHQAALKRGGRTIAVIGTGLSLCYPRTNVILQRRIAAECAVVSPFLPDTTPTAATMAARIPVMAGMATATIIVSAAAGTPADLAAHQHRPVILLEPLLRHKWARDLAHEDRVTVARDSAQAVAAAAQALPLR